MLSKHELEFFKWFPCLVYSFLPFSPGPPPFPEALGAGKERADGGRDPPEPSPLGAELRGGSRAAACPLCAPPGGPGTGREGPSPGLSGAPHSGARTSAGLWMFAPPPLAELPGGRGSAASVRGSTRSVRRLAPRAPVRRALQINPPPRPHGGSVPAWERPPGNLYTPGRWQVLRGKVTPGKREE